jgi:hypothetical protein
MQTVFDAASKPLDWTFMTAGLPFVAIAIVPWWFASPHALLPEECLREAQASRVRSLSPYARVPNAQIALSHLIWNQVNGWAVSRPDRNTDSTPGADRPG